MSPQDLRGSRPERSGDFVVSARLVAVCGVALAVVCLMALVVVSSVDGVDALSVIAITIALLAFVVQILVFNHQSTVSARQVERSEQVNAETRALLAELQAAARSTDAAVREQVSEVLKASLAPGHGPVPALPEERPAVHGDPGVRTESHGARLSLPGSERARARALARSRAQRLFARFPESEAGAPVLADLVALPAEARQRIRKLAEDEVRVTAEDTPETLGQPLETVDGSLEDRGLTNVGQIKFAGRIHTVSRLTERGKIAARLLLAPGERPAYAATELAGLSASPASHVARGAGS